MAKFGYGLQAAAAAICNTKLISNPRTDADEELTLQSRNKSNLRTHFEYILHLDFLQTSAYIP